MARIFREQVLGESLDQFADRAVTTTPFERTRFGQDVDTFVRCLHQKAFRSPYSVQEVLKSGSLGKGTAVRSLGDIDLVVFVNGLSSIADLQRTRGILLEDLKEKVDTLLRIWPVKSTRYSLSFEWQGNKVDILPAFDLRSRYGSPPNIYEAMRQFGSLQDAAQEFSVSLAPFQVEFVKPVPEHVKKVIRLTKLWNQGKSRHELYLFREVMKLLANCNALSVTFDDNYSSCMYTRYMTVPYIMDPANPFMNTLEGVSAYRVSECASRVLCRI